MKLINRNLETTAFNERNEYEENYAKGSGRILILLIIVKNGEVIGNGDVRYSVDLYDNNWNNIQTYPKYIVGPSGTYQAISFDYAASSIIDSLKLVIEPKKTSGFFIVQHFKELIRLPKVSAEAVFDTLNIRDLNSRKAFKKRIEYLFKAFSPSGDHIFQVAWTFVDIGTGQVWAIPNSQILPPRWLYNRY